MGATVLLTNDDGIDSPGISAMLGSLAGWSTVYVVAPDSERSGAGCSVTLKSEIESVPVARPPAASAWAITGTPVDAVKLAVAELVPEQIDLVVSGINSGPNVGVNVFYSGTVAAAIEAAVLGLPSVAVSLDFGAEMQYEAAASRASPLIRAALAGGLTRGCLVNINLPGGPADKAGPPMLTSHGRAGFREFYRPGGKAARSADGARRWRVEGEYVLGSDGAEMDAVALARGRISVTPMEIDLTAGSLLAGRGEWEFLLDGQERP